MTRHAAHTITCQSSINIRVLIARRRIRIVSGINQVSTKITVTAMIVIKASFAHYTVTLEARIVDESYLLRYLHWIGLEKISNERNFAVELRVEDRIAARQSHWRPTPLAEW